MMMKPKKKQKKRSSGWCDLTCRYAEFPDKLCDGSMSCRTFVALYCNLKKRIVEKNKECDYYDEQSS